jgi:hypothetical protein
MSCAANSESPTDPAPREEDDNDDLVLEEDGSTRQNDREENQIAVPEKLSVGLSIPSIIYDSTLFQC